MHIHVLQKVKHSRAFSQSNFMLNDDMSGKLQPQNGTKASVVATLGLFYQTKNDDKVSHQVSSHGQLFRPY